MSYHPHPPNDRAYWDAIKERALSLQSDGCSHVIDFYQEVCFAHDVHYRTHHDLDGVLIFKEEADLRLKQGIQDRSPFGRWSPMAWWRWKAVSWWGQSSWDKPESGTCLVDKFTCKLYRKKSRRKSP